MSLPESHPQENLLKLHSKLATVLSRLLDDPEVNPKVLDSVIKFLDNNQITLDTNVADPKKAQGETLSLLDKIAQKFAEEDIADVG